MSSIRLSDECRCRPNTQCIILKSTNAGKLAEEKPAQEMRMLVSCQAWNHISPVFPPC
jgi:hypothetical protein